MVRLRRLTGRPPEPAAAANPRSQAHPMAAHPSPVPPIEEPRDETLRREAVPVMATPVPPRAPSTAAPTHAWSAEDQPYDRLDCPACGTILQELPDRVATCPACGEAIHVLTCQEGVRHLLTVSDLDAFDDDWDALHARRKREEANRRNLAALQARRATLAAYIELGFRLFELRTAPDACSTCVAAAARPYRPKAVPALPIAGCSNDICRCLYAPARPSATRR
jgi:hypothetical protein